MPLYRPSELRSWLDQEGLTPSKGLSQNFLIDQNIVHKIIDLGELQSGQRVIEIGPGPGVLTEQLVARGYSVCVIELDPELGKRLPRLGPIEVIQADALQLNWPSFLEEQRHQHGPLTLLSNLPYHLSTPMFRLLLPLGQWLDKLIIMVQKEFAERLSQPTGKRDCCPLSVLADYYGILGGAINVSPGCFFPRPRVDSRVVRIDLQKRDPRAAAHLEKIIEISFAHRRKTLGKLLQPLSGQVSTELMQKWSALRAEQLSLQQWLQISDEFGSAL